MRRGLNKSPDHCWRAQLHTAKEKASIAGCPSLLQEQGWLPPRLFLIPLGVPVEYKREVTHKKRTSLFHFFFYCWGRLDSHTRKCVFSLFAPNRQTVLGELCFCFSPETSQHVTLARKKAGMQSEGKSGLHLKLLRHNRENMGTPSAFDNYRLVSKSKRL